MSTTVRTRDTQFCLRTGGAGMRSATEPELQEFGDMTRDEARIASQTGQGSPSRDRKGGA